MIRRGLLRPGTYTYYNFGHAGRNLRFTVPAGWSWNGQSLTKGGAAVCFCTGQRWATQILVTGTAPRTLSFLRLLSRVGASRTLSPPSRCDLNPSEGSRSQPL